MAQQDWEQYELPWNWTVQSNIVPQPTCAAKPLYLGLFAIENTVFVIFVVIYGAITLWIIRGKEIRNPFVLFILKVLTPLRLLKKGIGAFFTFICCLGKTDNGTGSVVSTIIMAVVFAGIQLSFNFATAYIIKYTPGYEDIPAPLLALLFCCRPRLGWLACALSRTPDRWLRQYFHLTPPDSLVRGQIAVARVAVSSAMSEVIMQLLGSYFLGKTAHIGAVRGFYLNGHLLPYFRGAQARLMYVGAMFWLVAGFGVVIVWIMVVFLHAKILHFYTTTKSWLKNLAATTIPEKVQPRRMHSWRKSEQPPRRRRSRIRSTDELNSRYDEGHYMRGGAGTPGTYGSDQLAPGFQNIRRDGGTFSSQNGASTPSAFDSLPMRPQDFPQAASSSQGGRPRTHRNGYTAVETTNPEMFQAGSGDFPPLLGVEYEENFRARTPTTTAYTRDDPGYIQRANFSSNAYPDVGYHGVENRDRENEGQREKSPPYDPETHIPSNFKEWQPYILALGIFLGFISYIAQWLFWAGFVNAAGERSVFPMPFLSNIIIYHNRFCPPRLGFVGTLWSIAAILGMPFFGPSYDWALKLQQVLDHLSACNRDFKGFLITLEYNANFALIRGADMGMRSTGIKSQLYVE